MRAAILCMTNTDFTTRTLRLRLKNRHAALLDAQAREVSFAGNYINELSLKILTREGRFCSNVELDRYTAGATKEGLPLHSQTVQAISKELVTHRRRADMPRDGSPLALPWLVCNCGRHVPPRA